MELQSFNKDGTRTSSKLELETERKGLPGIHTFSTDAHEAIEKEDASLLRIHLAERKKNMTTTEYSVGKIIFVFGLIGTTIAVVGFFGWYYFLKNTATETQGPVSYRPQTLMYYDSITPYSGGDIKNHINGVWATTTEGVHYIEILNASSSPVSLEDFSILSGIRIPNSLKRIASGAVMMGSTRDKNDSYPFILFKHTNSNQTLATMHGTENELSQIMSDIFGLEYISAVQYSDIRTSSGIARGYEKGGQFVGWGMNDEYVVISTKKDFVLDIIYKSNM